MNSEEKLREIEKIEAAIDLVNQYLTDQYLIGLTDGSERTSKSMAVIRPFWNWLHQRKMQIEEEKKKPEKGSGLIFVPSNAEEIKTISIPAERSINSMKGLKEEKDEIKALERL